MSTPTHARHTQRAPERQAAAQRLRLALWLLASSSLVLAACSGSSCGGASESGAPAPRASEAPAVAWSPVPPAPYRVMWHQVFEPDVDRAAAFYAAVAGWKTKKEGADHVMCLGEAGPVADVRLVTDAMRAAGARPFWSTLVQVADVDATADLARSHGARVVFGPTDVDGARVATFVNGEGVLFSVARWSPPLPPRDRRVLGEFLWDELATRDAKSAAALLRDLFAWTPLSETPSGTAGEYVVLARDGIPVAGLYADPALEGSGWMSYVHVADLDAAIGRATRAGGTVTLGPQAAGDERFAQLRDPQGAVFGLRESTSVTK